MTAGDACTVAAVVTAGGIAGAIGTAGGDFKPRDLADAECHGPMSALGQKQTCAVQSGMSALPPIATSIAFFGMSAMGQKRTSLALFDHLIGSRRGNL